MHGQSTSGTSKQSLLDHSFEAVDMKKMRTRRYMCLPSAGVNVFQTNRTVVVRRVGDAFVLFSRRKTQATYVTVGEIVSTTGSKKDLQSTSMDDSNIKGFMYPET